MLIAPTLRHEAAGHTAPVRMPALRHCAVLLAAQLISLTVLAPAAHAADAQGNAATAASQLRREYVLGPGDVVRINVYQNQDLTLEARVNETGFISYPLLGTVQLGGLAITQVEKAIAEGLQKGNFIKQPQVSVQLLQVRGNQASVLGMVNRPGRYPIEVTGLRLTELLATAGGIAATGSDVVTFTGVRGGQLMRRQIDVGAVLASGNMEQDIVIQNGDTLYVDRMPMVYIYGEVQRPGSMRVERGMTVQQVLANGGGLTQRGTVKEMKINRRGPDGRLAEFEPKLTDTVQEGDVIHVRQSLF